MISFPVRLSEKQHKHLKEIKREHGISMAAQIRTLIQRDMYGTSGRSEIRGTGSKRSRSTRSARSGSPGYSACVHELQKVFAKRKEMRR